MFAYLCEIMYFQLSLKKHHFLMNDYDLLNDLL
jgi:hypothetical protein